jgi:hypothetical protein
VIRTVARFTAVGAMSATMLALLPAAAPANLTFHAGSIQFANKAQLQEDGSVVMTVTYDCVPSFFGTEGSVEMKVEQPGTFGVAAVPANCDDRKHTVTLDIGPGPFKAGSAIATAILNDSTEVVAQKQAEIQIK